MKLSAKVRVSIILPTEFGLDKMTVKLTTNAGATWPVGDPIGWLTGLLKCIFIVGATNLISLPFNNLLLRHAENLFKEKNIATHT
jgi:hypothetical protein